MDSNRTQCLLLTYDLHVHTDVHVLRDAESHPVLKDAEYYPVLREAEYHPVLRD